MAKQVEYNLSMAMPSCYREVRAEERRRSAWEAVR